MKALNFVVAAEFKNPAEFFLAQTPKQVKLENKHKNIPWVIFPFSAEEEDSDFVLGIWAGCFCIEALKKAAH